MNPLNADTARYLETDGARVQPSRFEIVRREDFSDVTFLPELYDPLMARVVQPWQFVIVISHEQGERIPLTVADFDLKRGTITLVIQAVGKTTRQMQRDGKVGARLLGMLGPLGKPSYTRHGRKVVCVGGGLGVAPVFPQARAFKENGACVIGAVGFRTRSLVFWEDKFRQFCDEFIICSDDGPVGLQGLVTKGLEVAIERHPDIDTVVAIGPPVMMRACAETTRSRKIRTIVSLNPIMVDGTGMCGGCRVKVGGKAMSACVDGPEFDGHQVDFADLMNRLRRFEPQEQRALEDWMHPCRQIDGATHPWALQSPAG